MNDRLSEWWVWATMLIGPACGVGAVVVIEALIGSDIHPGAAIAIMFMVAGALAWGVCWLHDRRLM